MTVYEIIKEERVGMLPEGRMLCVQSMVRNSLHLHLHHFIHLFDIKDSRSFLNASYRSLLRSYILSPVNDPPSPALISLLDSPRVKFVDLSYLDNDSGTSLLHEAARHKDLRLIELAVRAGADVFVRNRKGKMAYEGSGKDDRVRVFLRQCLFLPLIKILSLLMITIAVANHDKTLIPNPTPLTEPPVLKGYLNKYTNVAKGYNTRWFVLKNGVLSCTLLFLLFVFMC
jgi:ankyrin repeat protein